MSPLPTDPAPPTAESQNGYQFDHNMWVIERPDHHCGDDLVSLSDDSVWLVPMVSLMRCGLPFDALALRADIDIAADEAIWVVIGFQYRWRDQYRISANVTDNKTRWPPSPTDHRCKKKFFFTFFLPKFFMLKKRWQNKKPNCLKQANYLAFCSLAIKYIGLLSDKSGDAPTDCRRRREIFSGAPISAQRDADL